MPSRHPTADDFDHRRDLLKHEPRPTDPPHRLDTPIPTPVEIAHLVKSVNILDGAKLIEQYAKTVSAGAAVETAGHAYRLVDKALTEMGR